ncbi:MAG: AAA family ATPase, partial [Bryobacteraceae bacterium]
MPLDYITIRGFKSIASIEKLPIRPINVLIGANGSGKSNFLDVFNFLGHIQEGRLAHYVGTSGGAENVLYFGSKTTQQLYLEVSYDSKGENRYELTLAPTSNDELFPSTEKVYFWDKEG